MSARTGSWVSLKGFQINSKSQKSIKNRGGGYYLFLALFFVLLSIPQLGFSAKADRILYQKGSYVFTQKDADNMLELAEYLGASRFSSNDKKALQAWLIDDFKAKLKIARGFYQSLAKVILPKVRKSKANNIYRAELYLKFVDSYEKHPEYRKSPNNFLAMVDRYHPLIKQALQIRQLRFNLLMQQMRGNQRLFNQSMQAMQKSNEIMTKSLQDQATRQAITLPDGKILREENGVIYAEDYKGEKFEVVK